MSNVRFQYLYRDGSNYKNCADVVFSNPQGLSVASVLTSLQGSLSGDGLFIAHQLRIPEVFLSDKYSLTEDDHCFHQFDGVEMTFDTPTDKCGRTIEEFVSEVATQAKRGWAAFDPYERARKLR